MPATAAGGRPSSIATIRRLVIGVLVATLVVPLAIVAAIEVLARSGRSEIADATTTAAREAAATTREAAWQAIAARHEVHLWIVDPAAGATRFDSDAQPRRSDLGMTSSIGYDPHLVDTVEDRRARPWQREHAQLAAGSGHSAGCATFDDDRLLVCEAAERLPGGEVALVQRAAPRIASRLVDAREGLLLVGGAVLVAGALLAAWLVRRLTRPLDELNRQVAARTGGQQAAIAIAGAPHEIAEVARAVDQLASRLEDQHRRQAVAAADLAHELKSPLARIKLALETRGGSADQPARSAAAKDAYAALDDHARRAVIAIDRIVGDLLEIARAEAGLREDDRAVVDVLALARQVAADRPPPPGIVVEVGGVSSEAPIAHAAVGRALGHLLDNAYTYAVARVAIAVAPGRLAVTDDGPGVPEELQPRLFERFASRRAGGTGLGLAYVRAVAEAHGGRAELSGPSTFVVYLDRNRG